MSRNPPPCPDGTVARAFRRSLRAMRLRCDLSVAEAGERIGRTEALVTAVEEGTADPDEGLLAELDGLLEAGGLLIELWEDVKQEQRRADAAATMERMTLTQLMVAIGLDAVITEEGAATLRRRFEGALPGARPNASDAADPPRAT